MSEPEKYRLWVVDTRPESFALVTRTLGACDFVSLRHVTAAEAMLAELDRFVMDTAHLPHVILLDFFMETMTAPEILPEFQQKFVMQPDIKPYLIAFSTMDRANDGMLGMGADFKIEKKRDAPVCEPLKQMFSSKDALRAQLAQRASGEADAIALPADEF